MDYYKRLLINDVHPEAYMYYIRITCPCKVYPTNPHFYMVKLAEAGLTCTHNVYLSKIKKHI